MSKNFKSCDIVADFFLVQMDVNAGDSITNLKIQKLCYYAQGWSLALYDRPAFNNEIQAWAHGPAIPELYRRFKDKGWNALDATSLITDPIAELISEDRDLLQAISNKYGEYSGKQLEWMTHNESPWLDAYGDRLPGSKCENVITLDAMSGFFKELAEQSDESNTGSASTAHNQPLSQAG